MHRLGERHAVQEENGSIVLYRCNKAGSEITDKIPLNEHELRALIMFTHNAVGIPEDMPREEAQ